MIAVLVPFALLMSYAFIPYNEHDIEKSELSTAEVYAIHDIELKEDVDGCSLLIEIQKLNPPPVGKLWPPPGSILSEVYQIA